MFAKTRSVIVVALRLYVFTDPLVAGRPTATHLVGMLTEKVDQEHTSWTIAQVAPQRLQALADVGVGEVGEPDAMRAWVGEGRVGGAGTRELGVPLDDVADVDDDQERWPALVGRQCARVTLGLAAIARLRVDLPVH